MQTGFNLWLSSLFLTRGEYFKADAIKPCPTQCCVSVASVSQRTSGMYAKASSLKHFRSLSIKVLPQLSARFCEVESRKLLVDVPQSQWLIECYRMQLSRFVFGVAR